MYSVIVYRDRVDKMGIRLYSGFMKNNDKKEHKIVDNVLRFLGLWSIFDIGMRRPRV